LGVALTRAWHSFNMPERGGKVILVVLAILMTLAYLLGLI
jgi:hypothetical protein